MTVQAVIGYVEFAADKPLGERKLPFQHLVPRFKPVQFTRDAGPEFLGMLFGAAVNQLIFFQALDVRSGSEFVRGREYALFLKRGGDGGFECHGLNSRLSYYRAMSSNPMEAFQNVVRGIA